MKPIEKGYSYCKFIYDGSDDVFEFAFVGGYISKVFIEVYKTSDEVGAEQTPLEYSLISEYSIRIDKPLLSVGDVVIIKRNTQAEKIVDFQAGALRTPKNLDTATQQAMDIAVEAKDAYTAIEGTIDQFNDLAGKLFEVSEATQIVADNIDSVNTDANSIDNINVVAGDFTGHTDPVSMPEWGEVGVERDPVYVPTGGNIYTVAKNIDSVNIDAANIEYIKKVADNVDTITDVAAEVKTLVDQAKESALNASNSASEAELAKQGAETAKAQAEAVQSEVATQISAIGAQVTIATEQAQIATNKATEASQSASTAKSEADRAVEAANNATAAQLQADWNQTDSSKKDFIKNKPTLGALASKDVVAYNEVQGTPDLTLYWLKTDRLPAPDLGEVGVN